MKSKRLGCLSINGMLAALFSAAVMCAAYLGWGGAMFSPGPLNAQAAAAPVGGVFSHAETGGRCSSCHAVPFSSTNMAMRCLDCHGDLEAVLSASENLHGFFMEKNGRIICRDCHSEHNGAEASLTDFNGTDFPHELFGFSLEGHRRNLDGKGFVCSDCHGANDFDFTLATCEICHMAFEPDLMASHVQDFGPECLACHDGVDQYARPFDHRSVGIELGPAHDEVACVECHIDAHSSTDLQKATFTCVACHRADDAHVGAFGTQCGACHIPTTWEAVNVNHDLTGFPLDGMHVDVPCESCHIGGVFDGTPTACSECHWQDDIHNQAFGVDCGACHSTAGFEFVSFDHTSDIAVNCISCHQSDRPANHFPGQCSLCHTTDTWLGAVFRHSFPINHGRANGDCSRCHPSGIETYTCYTCHNKSKMVKEHRGEGVGSIDNCIRCHPDGREHD